jgi:hypothetical protein
MRTCASCLLSYILQPSTSEEQALRRNAGYWGKCEEPTRQKGSRRRPSTDASHGHGFIPRTNLLPHRSCSRASILSTGSPRAVARSTRRGPASRNCFIIAITWPHREGGTEPVRLLKSSTYVVNRDTVPLRSHTWPLSATIDVAVRSTPCRVCAPLSNSQLCDDAPRDRRGGASLSLIALMKIGNVVASL